MIDTQLPPCYNKFSVYGNGTIEMGRWGLKLIVRSNDIRALFVAVVLLSSSCFSQIAGDQASQAHWAELASFGYGISSNVTYGVFNNVPVRLDVWHTNHPTGPVPTLIYFHGGGWLIGEKNGAENLFLPYVQQGWNVVNVEYRLGGTSLAPAAVQDVRCALRWVYRNADQYHIDIHRIVTTGHSAGGHLALIAGMLPDNTDLDSQCPAGPGEPPLKVAAVVNWFGITDVNDILSGPNRQTYAVAWLGTQADRAEIAKHVSPLTYVRPGLPAVITIHGDHDPTVPYSQAVRLQDALTRANVPNQLVTIAGGVHGGFSDAQTIEAFNQIWKFLNIHVTGEASKAASGGQ